MFEVGRPAQLLPEPGPAGAPFTPAQGRVPGLGVVHEVGQQPGQGGADEEVVVGGAVRECLGAQPGGLAGVEHRAVLLVEDAGRPAVHHQQPDAAEVAPVAPAGGGRVGVGAGGEARSSSVPSGASRTAE